jgi:hypothetical protein
MKPQHRVLRLELSALHQLELVLQPEKGTKYYDLYWDFSN